MTKKKAKVRDGGFDAMLNAPRLPAGEKPSTNRVTLFLDAKGWFALAWPTSRFPTRDELIAAELRTPRCTPTGKDALGRWQYDERQPTQAEAEYTIDSYLRGRTRHEA